MRFSITFGLKNIITRDKGKGGGGYNLSTGQITHPPAGSGKKAPKITSKTKITKSK